MGNWISETLDSIDRCDFVLVLFTELNITAFHAGDAATFGAPAFRPNPEKQITAFSYA